MERYLFSIKSSRKWLTGLSAVTVAAVVAACGSSGSSSPNASASVRTVTIGFPNDLTGGNAFAGIEQRDMAELAVANFNAAHKNVHLVLKVQDSLSTPQGAVSATEQLIQQDKVDAIVGISSSQSGLAVQPILSQAKIPTIFLQVGDMGKNRTDNLFSMSTPPDSYEPLALSGFLKPKGAKSVAFIWQDQPVLDADMTVLRSGAKSDGIAVVADKGGTLDQTDFSSQITSVLSAKPDAIGIICIPTVSGTIVASLRQQGYKGLIFGQQGTGNADFGKVAGSAAVGVVYPTQWSPVNATPAADAVIKKFQSAYPSAGAVDSFGQEAWDGIQIIGNAYAKSDGSAASVDSQLGSATFTGNMQSPEKFDSSGFLVSNGSLIEFTSSGQAPYNQ